ncbi:MAG: hypothetical protein ACT4PV_14650 [Planctomycetaceae bacterium]
MRVPRLAAALLALSMVTGCGGGGSVLPDFDLQALSDCTGLTIEQIGAIFESIGDLLEVAEGGSLPNIVFGPGAGPNSFTFTMFLDLDGDSSSETTIGGAANFSANPLDGIEVGDTVNLQLNAINGTALTGNGNLRLTFIAPDAVQVAPGTLSLVGTGGCSMEVTAMDLTLSTSDLVAGFPTGTIDFEVGVLGDLLAATITFDGTSIANVSGLVNGLADVIFDIDLS